MIIISLVRVFVFKAGMERGAAVASGFLLMIYFNQGSFVQSVQEFGLKHGGISSLSPSVVIECEPDGLPPVHSP